MIHREEEVASYKAFRAKTQGLKTVEGVKRSIGLDGSLTICDENGLTLAHWDTREQVGFVDYHVA